MKKHHVINIGAILRVFGISILCIGVFMISAIAVSLYFSDGAVLSIIYASMISVGFGSTLTFLTRKHKLDEIGEREAFFIVTLTWIMAGLFGSLPYLFSGAIPDFTNAYFETVSGFTTTGASILTEIESLPKSILFWRSVTHWLGGMGILVLVIAILPVIGFGGIKLFVAEAPGASTNKIHPRIRQTALRLWGIYALLTFLLTVLLIAGNMSVFDSTCHAMATLSTGGFSPKNTSIAGYSPYIQIVITFFMFFGGMNFVLHYFLLKGKFRKILKNEEWLSYIAFMILVSFAVAINIYSNGHYPGFAESLRHSFFQCISIATATGFATADYMAWPQMTWILLLLLFFTGGMIGSTSGGIKFTRHLVLFKNLRAEIKKQLHPNSIANVKLNGVPIPDEIIRNFLAVFIAYILIFFVGTLFMSLYTDTALEAFGSTLSCMGGVGPAFGKFGPAGNYNNLDQAAKFFLSIIMVVGRIELFPFILIFTKSFWKA
jgi:trk system potassium uptake protein